MSQNKLTVYVVQDGPEDYWYGWEKLPVLEKSINGFQSPIHVRSERDGFDLLEVLHQVLSATKEAAQQLGWEGDIRGDSAYGFVSPAGYGARPHVTVGFKQDNNGQCFYGSTDINFGSILYQYGDVHESSRAIVDVVTSIAVRLIEP